MTTAFRFTRTGGELLLEGEIRHVWIDPGTGAKAPMPGWAREGIAPWHLPGSSGAAPPPEVPEPG
jgi:acyl-CoA thioesterase FadM